MLFNVTSPIFFLLQTQYLSALGGHSLGDAVCRIFQKLGANSVWSSYSLKGNKGKQAYTDLPLCSVVISKCTLTFLNLLSQINIT